MAHLTIRLPESIEQQIDQIARALNQPKSVVMRALLKKAFSQGGELTHADIAEARQNA